MQLYGKALKMFLIVVKLIKTNSNTRKIHKADHLCELLLNKTTSSFFYNQIVDKFS